MESSIVKNPYAFPTECIMNILKDDDKYNSILVLYNEYVNNQKEILKNQKQILKNQEEILENQEDTKQEVHHIRYTTDTLYEFFINISKKILEIKTETRNPEEKIGLIYNILNKFETDQCDSNDLDGYIAIAQGKYEYWDEYEEETRSYLPLSEYLYSKLQNLENGNASNKENLLNNKILDYSPVIIEACRAIEYEFLIKIFSRYAIDLISRKPGIEMTDFLYADECYNRLERYSRNKTDVFVKAIKQAAKKKGRINCTLGNMNVILQMLKNKYLVSKSPLLQDFQEYLKRTVNSEKLLDSDYADRINDIVDRFRNKSAHPNIMDENAALECKDDVIPTNIDYLIACLLY